MVMTTSKARAIANEAALQGLLNCYLRETGAGEWLKAGETPSGMAAGGRKAAETVAGADGLVVCPLPEQGAALLIGVKYRSVTGRHLFRFPMVIVYGGAADRVVEADYLTVAALLTKELTLAAEQAAKQAGQLADAVEGASSAPGAGSEELMLRIIQSTANVAQFVEARAIDADTLYAFASGFIEQEQALLFGHLLHPTPKSRQGVPEERQADYSPELKGAFQLHYYRAHRSIVIEDSSVETSATELVKQELRDDASVPAEWVAAYASADAGWSLLPVHPLQANWLQDRPYVQEAIRAGLLQYLGPQGKAYAATSSLRTVYHPESRFMYKCSVPVKVTNSLRVNLYKELERGVEVSRLLDTAIGDVRKQYEGFGIVTDPAFITLRLGESEGIRETGFELVLRDNLFQAGNGAAEATPVASLVQDALPGYKSRIGVIIEELAQREGRTTADVSADWFGRYLELSLKPMVSLYMQWGIALEAHQQNSVVSLEEGYPTKFYYRDNQGYYFCKSTESLLNEQLPGIGERSETVCEDAIADERFRYYLIFNHMFGLINGFGAAGLIDERVLLGKLRAALASFLPVNREPSVFLHSLLNEPTLPCKANLLTRLHDMDELVGSLDTQSVYVQVPNPLVEEVSGHGVNAENEAAAVR
ncbi:IucA/IucC family protein [Paenibacillus sp. MMS18-CY102]|uniref:IucA/IucC family protein n=1 Tax=Paenibacillus sp. MMS18-CY102 TaxID=2682849 RepID=UPI001365455A|nr:IucA/IucC family protein [Paenibacillus sp. MMS18-CY102]MWC29954.1 IucA/IucC family siderophore biosynthesis protein [Paenibacillus sp. MMS18-CY102]